MIKEFTCIICPNGCEIEADLREDGSIIEVRGATCPRGVTYVKQELTDPRRTIASSVMVKHGELPLVSVRLNHPVPKNRIFDVMNEIRRVTLEAPVHTGDVVIQDVLGLGSDVIVTKDVDRRSSIG